MPKTLYKYVGAPSLFEQSEHREAIRTETSAGDGDIVIKSNAPADLHLECAIDHPITLTHFMSRNGAEVNWRRSADLVRSRGGGFVLFRFLERGSARIVTSHETTVLEKGRFNITRGDLPYLSQTLPDAAGVHESYQVWIPLHRVASRLPEEAFSGSFSRDTPAGAVAGALMPLLFHHGESVDFALREKLAEALISALIACVHEEREIQPARCGIGETRLANLMDFIGSHAVQADLNARTVARHCGMSRRYMSSLFAREGLHFSDILRDARLDHAASLLGSMDAANWTIGEIARFSGFRSASYFSRVFKATRGKSPRRYRSEQLAAPALVKLEGAAWGDAGPAARQPRIERLGHKTAATPEHRRSAGRSVSRSDEYREMIR